MFDKFLHDDLMYTSITFSMFDIKLFQLVSYGAGSV